MTSIRVRLILEQSQASLSLVKNLNRLIGADAEISEDGEVFRMNPSATLEDAVYSLFKSGDRRVLELHFEKEDD